MKRVLCLALALVLCISMIPVAFAADDQNDGGNIVVTNENNKVVIGNEYISREFSTSEKKLKTTKIVNKRTGTQQLDLVPGEGSEEFKIRFTKQNNETDGMEMTAINRSKWVAKADSYQNAQGNSDGPPKNMIDGNNDSIWHTQYNANGASNNNNYAYPHNIVFDFNESITFQSFSYTPRQDAENGNIKGYELWYTTSQNDNIDYSSGEWTKVCEGEFPSEGSNTVYVNLDSAITAYQIKLVATSSQNGRDFAGGAEFNIYADKVPENIKLDRELYSSDLELASDNAVKIEDTTATINKVEKTGKKVTFTFAPKEFRGVTYTVKEVIVMYNGDHFMRKFLEISVPNNQKDNAVIDFIDLEALVIDKDYPQWTIPTDAGGIVEMNQFKANLGQPIYVQGMFFGCEFPVTDTQIQKSIARIRYYSGKSFTQLGNDHQLTSDTSAATYVTWQTVAGAARSTDNSVIQQDFFDYIDSIATPSEFRIQYNSWFDNMMRIDETNTFNSFIRIDKGFTSTGVRPLDSYVIDDGWNNYNNTTVEQPERSGNTLNSTGFWELNSKFPNQLNTLSDLAHNLGSDFGVWVGPRGGYNFYNAMANILTRSKKGSMLGNSIDVADRNYVQNFENMTIEFQEKYGVNYWKWDGFVDTAQYNAGNISGVGDGIPGRLNNHMVGGYNQMYHVSDCWEAWIDLFEHVRTKAEEQHIKNFWLSITCYVNPSPWFLQWVNSVWMQCNLDRGENGPLSDKMNSMLTYRDAAYYCFLEEHEFQFPLKSVYNHDPIYGTEGTNITSTSMDDEQFKNYLYTMAGRGTSFWELYYSDSIMTQGKYEANAEFLKWAEENFHILQHAKMIGGDPADTVTLAQNPHTDNCNPYAFSAWDGEEGIITMRNPDNETTHLSFTLDRKIGVSESIMNKTLYRTTVHSYNSTNDTNKTTFQYGDTVDVTLQPGEVRTWYLSTVQDTTAPSIERVYFEDNNVIVVKFNEKMKGTITSDSFKVDGYNVTNVEQSVDDITYRITIDTTPGDKTYLTVAASEGITDLSGNACPDIAYVTYRQDGKVFTVSDITSVQTQENPDLQTNNPFSVFATVETSNKNVIIAKQENGYILGIDNDGKAYIELNGTRATSDVAVNDGRINEITGVREANGMLKIYVDGEISGAGYNAENKDYMIQMGDTTFGEGLTSGTIHSVSVYELAIPFDEVENYDSERPISSSHLTAKPSGTSEGNIDSIFDNNPTSFWTSQEVNNVSGKEANLVIELDDVYTIDRVDYTKRFDNGSATIWKCTGNIETYVLEVSTDGKNWTEVSSGATFDDEAYTEAKDGGTTYITFNPVEASYIRLTANTTYHWQADKVNKFMTVGDITIYGKSKSISVGVDKSVLNAKIDEAEAMLADEDLDMNAGMRAAITEALENAKKVSEDGETTQMQVNRAMSKLQRAMLFGGDGVYGDVNHDNNINAGDATLVLQRYAGIIGDDNEEYDPAFADVNNDGAVDAGDATLILQRYAGIVTVFPVEA